MKILSIFFHAVNEIYNELVCKVSWPSKEELSTTVTIVIWSSLVVAIIIFVIDFSFETFMTFFYRGIF